MSIDGGKTIQIHGVIAHKYNTDKPCPYCGKTGGIYESTDVIGGGNGLIGVYMTFEYHCIFCKHQWRSWEEAKKFNLIFKNLAERLKKEK